MLKHNFGITQTQITLFLIAVDGVLVVFYGIFIDSFAVSDTWTF